MLDLQPGIIASSLVSSFQFIQLHFLSLHNHLPVYMYVCTACVWQCEHAVFLGTICKFSFIHSSMRNSICRNQWIRLWLVVSWILLHSNVTFVVDWAVNVKRFAYIMSVRQASVVCNWSLMTDETYYSARRKLKAHWRLFLSQRLVSCYHGNCSRRKWRRVPQPSSTTSCSPACCLVSACCYGYVDLLTRGGGVRVM